MSDEQQPGVRKTIEVALVTAATQGIATLAAAPFGPIPQAVAAAVSQALSVIYERLRDGSRRRGDLVLKGAAINDEPYDEILIMMEHASETDDGRNVIRETLQRLADTLCDEVVPILGRLMREYIDAQRPPDAYLRGTMRVLSEISAAELAEFRQLLAHLEEVSSAVGQPTALHLAVVEDRPGYLSVRAVDEVANEAGVAVADANRLVMLLTTNHLASPHNMWGDAPAMNVRRTLVHRLHALLTA